MADAPVTVEGQLTADEELHLGTTVSETENQAAKIVITMKKLKGRPNPNKFGLIAISLGAKGVQVHVATIEVHEET